MWVSFAYTREQGRAMPTNNMTNVYRNRTTKDLLTLRSKKHVRLQKLAAAWSWFDKREREMLVATMKQIDVELASRFDQTQMF